MLENPGTQGSARHLVPAQSSIPNTIAYFADYFDYETVTISAGATGKGLAPGITHSQLGWAGSIPQCRVLSNECGVFHFRGKDLTGFRISLVLKLIWLLSAEPMLKDRI